MTLTSSDIEYLFHININYCRLYTFFFYISKTINEKSLNSLEELTQVSNFQNMLNCQMQRIDNNLKKEKE